jgi:hypothetical protein
MSEPRESFLSQLIRKKAMVIGLGEQSGARVDAALGEVDRQIRQVSINKGNPITGEGVTKSNQLR